VLSVLTNAITYNHAGGRVSIACQTPSPESVRIAIADTGPGISAEQMARLFDPFDRLGAERTGVQGTGLSLTIAQALAKAMGGQLDASSVVGSGSTFWLDLPRAAERGEVVAAPVARLAHSDAPPDAPAPACPEPCYVLYVEDDRQNALLVRRSLAWRPDVTLLSVESAVDGLTLARDHLPSLILTDLHLPDMSGAEMLARLRDDDSTAQIPVVIVSADADEHQSERLLAAGARAYLTKPFDVRAFLGIVDEILQEAP
jgi:CheY-like chemotaxis protein